MRRFVCLLLAGLIAVLATPARANGWEHWGVPLDVLLGTLTGDQPEYQIVAARSLGYRREAAAVAPLLDIVARADTPAPVTAAAVEALGRIGDARALVPLHRLLREAPREELRAEAATALGTIGAEGSLPELLAALARETSLTARAAVVGALGAFRRAEAVAAVAALLDDPGQRALRPRAVQALGRMGPTAAPPLLAALREARSDGARIDIVDALAQTGAAEAAAPLATLVAGAASPELRVRVAVALGAIRDGSAVPTLIDLLSDDAAPVRYFAVRSLAAAGDARAAEPLRALFRRIANALPALGPGAIPPQPAAFLADLTLRIEIAAALVDLDAPGSFAVFADAVVPQEFPRDSALGLRLNEGVYELRRSAIVGLGYTKAADAAKLLAEGPLADRDFRLRAAAVRALGVLGAPASLAVLLTRLADESPEVRWETAFVLGRFGAAEAAAPLAARLDDPHAEVRRQTALALAMLGARDTRPALATLAGRDPDERVRAAAAAALGVLGAR